ncbi:LIM domain only protein 7 isoform X2 [Maniola jurtina]|uniref:LIM domain only protein 7 isoform X2 n=1 Tax=Maniola jurtina TaxID=191418 RepID=UPI001E68FC9E|nr:LIM domain only protein 7 isoform X2 [Maniola jurtina]
MPSDSGATWSPPAPSERRLSNSSDGSAGSGYSKATSDSADFLTTRPHTAAVLPGKPAANPLQFVKVGPADLGHKAREQLRRAELAKKTEPARIERQEDWQSNLDNWKSSRRKRVEHIIERCVEVRRFENESHSQPRAKAKTFNEMLEERAGRRRRNPLALYTEDDGHDLSDLGIGTSSTKSSLSEDCDTHSLASDGMDHDKNHSDVDHTSNCDHNRKLGSSANEYDTCTTTTISSPEPEEYTYEGAIEGYKSRIISQTNSNIVKTVVNNNLKEKSPDTSNGDINRIRTSVSNKIEEKVFSFQQERANDLKNNNQKKDLPKVDIHKRREQFERENSQELQIRKPKLPDMANKKSIKERLSSLEKFNEESYFQKSSSDLTKLPVEVKPLKERLSSLNNLKSSTAEVDKVKRLSNGDLSNTKSLKERLSSLKSQTTEEEVKVTKTEVKEVSMSIKERLSCLDAAKNKEVPKLSIEEEIMQNDQIKEEADYNELKDKLSDSSYKLEDQMQSFCRSLDSLDINGQSSPNSFERIQSLEDFDCGEIQNNTVPSDIETEDSGIHTARDSCAPADDIADLTQVASPIGEPMAEVSEYESSNEDGATLVPTKIEEPDDMNAEPKHQLKTEFLIQEYEKESQADDSDSASNYTQAVSQPEELSVTEVTEIQMDREDEDTLKSLDNQDSSSVSLNEPVSTTSEGDTVVFEGKMTIHLNLNEICNNMSTGARESSNTNEIRTNDSTNNKSMSMVIDALELAFKELDSEESVNVTMDENDSDSNDKTPKTITLDNVDKLLDFDVEKKVSVTPLYENIDIFNQNGIVDAEAFPLDLPTNALEPPKEKPPPPPMEDNAEDELLGNGNFKHTSSARRIKKEIRNKRTSFLGIEGQDDSYLDVDLTLAPRPDITSFLQEETKIEKLLYKKTLANEMDAKLRDSRDSGVDVDRGSDGWYKRHSSPETSNPHSRQNSEPYTQMTVTSDEEEAAKKTTEESFSKDLTTKLGGLTENGENHETKIDHLDKKIQKQQEVLRFERELLQLEQEELRRQRENLLRDQNRIIQKSVQDISTTGVPEKPIVPRNKPTNHNYRHSMPNLLVSENYIPPPVIPKSVPMDENMKRKPFVSEEHIQSHFGVEESRKVLFDDKMKYAEVRRPVPNVTRPPQPILPPKPRSRDSIEREITMRSSRVPSAVEYANVERTSAQLRQKSANANGQYQHMTRHTLQALSAAPTPKLISNTEWLQTRQPPARQKPHNFNYNQHWLIQEAEQRRLQEQRSPARVVPRYSRDMPLRAHQLNNATPERRPVRPELARDVPRSAEPREDKMLSVSGRRKCSHCGEELGRGAAMIIESLSLCYHVWCFTCAVCGAALGDGRAGADVRVRARRLHCHHCYSSDDGSKYSCV